MVIVGKYAHKKNDKRVFKIGEWVITDIIVEMGYREKQRIAERVRRKVYGQITGACIRYLGQYVPASGSGHLNNWGIDEGGHEQAALVIDGTVTLWEIREGYLNKPVLAFAEDIKPAIGVLNGSVPWKCVAQSELDKETRREMSEQARRQKRANGKFAK